MLRRVSYFLEDVFPHLETSHHLLAKPALQFDQSSAKQNWQFTSKTVSEGVEPFDSKSAAGTRALF